MSLKQIEKETEEKEQLDIEVISAYEDTIKFLLRKLRELKIKKNQETGSLELELKEIQEKYRQATSDFDHESEVIIEEIKKLLPSVAHTVKTDNGSANFKKGSVRASYDTKALDAIENKFVAEYIKPFRKETSVSHSVSVEVY